MSKNPSATIAPHPDVSGLEPASSAPGEGRSSILNPPTRDVYSTSEATVDPEQITQIFCPFCRKGVAVRGEIPEETVCPHCEKNFPTGEFAAPQPTHRTSFVSSHPPVNAVVRSDTRPLERPRARFDQKVSATLKGINQNIPDALFWGIGAVAGIVAPFIDELTQQVGRVTILSTLVFMYLWWLRHYGARPHQTGPFSFLSNLARLWRAGGYSFQVRATAGMLLGLSCLLLGGINVVALVDVSVGPLVNVDLTKWNWPIRAFGLSLLVVGGILKAASGRGAETPLKP